MKLSSTHFSDGAPIPGELAFCIPADSDHVCLGGNHSPQLSWRDVPAGTRSFVIICHDPDVPSVGDDVNQEGRQVAADLPRVEFSHWVLVDLPANVTEIATGQFGSEVTPGGKPGPAAALGARHGLNDFGVWFAGDEAMKGDYYGYDGPCPPWNDLLLHRYVFTVYALDIERCAVEGRFTMADVRAAMAGHILAQASLTGTYSLNPALKGAG